MEPAVTVDDGVGAELTGVVGRRAQPPALAEQTCVHHHRAGRPDLAERSTTGPEQVVEAPVDVGEQRELDLEVISVGGEPLWVVAEGDDDGKGVTELIEVIAHGDHVFLARQSSEVAVQDQHQRATAMVVESPPMSVVIDEGDVREHVTLADHLSVGHAMAPRASSMPRWNVG